MTKQLRYPAEAFALAMVLFSGNLSLAMIVGIGIIFAAVLQQVFHETAGETYSPVVSVMGALIGVEAIYAMMLFLKMPLGVKEYASLAALCLMLVKSDLRAKTADVDYDELLARSSCAYGFYALVALVREYLSRATILGYKFPTFVSNGDVFATVFMALFFAAAAMLLVNLILKVRTDAFSALCVCVPVLLIEAPFVWKNAGNVFGLVLGTVCGLVVYLVVRKVLTLALG